MPADTFDLSRNLNPTRADGRILPLDGLRGFLAFGVFLHHAAIYRQYLRGEGWWTPAGVIAGLGPVAVSLFFMMTAFLFYGRLLAERGRPNWRRLYLGRLFRIGPVYLLAIGGLFGMVAAGSGFRLRVPVGQLAGEVASWLALGAGPRLDLNAIPDTRHLLAGVTWTLQSEWLFYASLPLLALVIRRGDRATLGLPVLGLGLALIGLACTPAGILPACIAPFCAGMLCARLRGRAGAVRPAWGSSSAVAVIVAFVLGLGLDPRQPAAVLLLGAAFALIVNGGTVFGLLTCRPARWLGEISYGVYLLHGLVLALLCAIPAIRALALGSTVGHWCMVLLATACVLACAWLAHVLIEAPGIRLGQRLGRRLQRDRPGPDAPYSAALAPGAGR